MSVLAAFLPTPLVGLDQLPSDEGVRANLAGEDWFTCHKAAGELRQLYTRRKQSPEVEARLIELCNIVLSIEKAKYSEAVNVAQAEAGRDAYNRNVLGKHDA